VLEEFSPKLVYIKGENNIIADAVSCLDKVNSKKSKKPKLEELQNYMLLIMRIYLQIYFPPHIQIFKKVSRKIKNTPML